MGKEGSVLLGIGDLARRSGVAPSALRFYEEKGLISAERTGGNQRRYPRAMLRRVALLRVAQALGISLAEIGRALATLPDQRTPGKRDWQSLSRRWRKDLDARIEALERMRKRLDSCIGCGCLSIKDCELFNPGDQAASKGAGPRYLMGDRPEGTP